MRKERRLVFSPRSKTLEHPKTSNSSIIDLLLPQGLHNKTKSCREMLRVLYPKQNKNNQQTRSRSHSKWRGEETFVRDTGPHLYICKLLDTFDRTDVFALQHHRCQKGPFRWVSDKHRVCIPLRNGGDMYCETPPFWTWTSPPSLMWPTLHLCSIL